MIHTLEYDDIRNYGHGWKYTKYPSAEGASFVKGNLQCQILAPNSVNAINAGDKTNPNFTLWDRTTGKVLFLGHVNNIEDLKTILK